MPLSKFGVVHLESFLMPFDTWLDKVRSYSDTFLQSELVQPVLV